jgi:group I intron endonuclease
MVADQNNAIGVYRIRNILNNKSYIGSSLKIQRRLKIHRDDLNKQISHSDKLQRAWNKYKEKNFEFSILVYCDKKNLLDVEESYIRKYDSVKNGYNACYRGRSALGVKRSKEFKEKCRKAQQEIIKRPGERKRRSEQVKKSFADGNRKPMTISKAERKRRSEFAKNRKKSKKEKIDISIRFRKLRKSKKFNAGLNIWNRSDRKRKFMAKTMSGYWADPVWKKRQIKKQRAAGKRRRQKHGTHKNS